MEDTLSVKSNESLPTSEEYDFVSDKPYANSKSPILEIVNADLMYALKDAVMDTPHSTMDTLIDNNPKKVGHSVFYSSPVQIGDDPLTAPLGSPVTEKQDVMKPDDYSDEEVSDVDQDCTIFGGVSYLGAATINAPKSETEIQRNMSILNEQSSDLGIKVAISVPSTSQGLVILYDAATNSVIARYEIHRILFYARGAVDTPEASCFAFTWSHGDDQESAIFQCHVFRCDITEAVSRVSACFAKAFRRIPKSMSSSVTSAADFKGSVTTLCTLRTLMYVFEVNLEIKEDDGKGTFTTVAKDRNGFKFRANLEKELCLSIKQVSDNGPRLHIERCFGVLIAAGRHVRHADMQLLEMKEQNNASEGENVAVSATWDPTEASFEALNLETRDTQQYMTVAVDLVIRGIREPVRFLMETPVKVFPQTERIWYFQKRSLVQQFFLNLKEVLHEDDAAVPDLYYEVIGMETSGELDRNRLNLTLNLSNLIQQSPSAVDVATTPKDECASSDGDEPLLSGTGSVSKDCPEDVLESWADVLSKWKMTRQRPKQLAGLVRLGIPEALRGEVWQRLAGTEECVALMENYRLLITKESSCESIIQRDIARTFPAHDFFKEAGGLGQDSLYRVSKAYAVYDKEVGYCQGLSFLAATLLLHMPEEQAFCVLVKIMYDYGLRDLYKDGFDSLYLRLYQLNRMMEEQLNVLWNHFKEHHVETHMYASQWFLTLFTARFPLHFVFHILDVFLLQGISTLFQISMGLLTICKKDLLRLDFEGILKYFRVSLPKKCRNEESSRQLIKLACTVKVKKLKKYEAEFAALKEAAESAEKEATEVEQLRMTVARYEEENKLMSDEVAKLKEMLKREVAQAETDKRTSAMLIGDYKTIKRRLEAQLTAAKEELAKIKELVSSCDKCKSFVLEASEEDALKEVSNEESFLHDDGKALERVRELELELAQTKLAHVEAECRNQDLTHQLRATEIELTTTKNTWPPWLSKTLSSIKEVANKKDFPHFSYPGNNVTPNTPSFLSHIGSLRRESSGLKGDIYDEVDAVVTTD